jgi:hypothetical protein
MASIPRTYADVESLITMLQAACEDVGMNDTLQHLLSQPDQTRRAVVLKLVDHLRTQRAPSDFIDAFVCFLDDEVAEKAYQVIYQCSRKGR